MSRLAATLHRRSHPVLLTIGIIVLASFVLAACEPERTPRRRSTIATATSQEDERGDNVIQIKNFEFVPVRLTVPVGTQVIWINGDGTNHIIGDADLSWRVGILSPGASGSFQFDNPGQHTYVCSIHANMRGTLVVE